MSVRRWLGLMLVGLLAGCGPSNGLDLGRVHGKITYKGELVGCGDIIFQPDESRGTSGPAAVGTLARDGTFVLSTEWPGDGAIVGFHRVGITGLDPNPVGGSTGPEFVGKAALKSSITIRKGRSSLHPAAGQPPVVVRGRTTYRLVTPEKLCNPEGSGLSVEVKRGSNTVNIVIRENGEATIEP